VPTATGNNPQAAPFPQPRPRTDIAPAPSGQSARAAILWPPSATP